MLVIPGDQLRRDLQQSVKDALQKVGVAGMTVTEVKGFGRQKGHTATYRGSEYKIEFVPKLKIEIAVPDDVAAAAVTAISESAKTGASK